MAKDKVVGKFKSKSSPGVVWYVTRKGNGALVCDCPGYTYSKRIPQKCRHIDSIEFKATHDGSPADV